jgi:hypothetical protein
MRKGFTMLCRRFTVLAAAAAAAVSIGAAVLPGCSQDKPEDAQAIHDFHSRFAPGDEPTMTVVPSDGYYELFRNGHSMSRFELKKGDKIGFSRKPLEYISATKPEYRWAVGGDHDFLIDNHSTYEWRKVPFKTTGDYFPRTVY